MSLFQHKKKILVVEDENDIAEAIQARLELDDFDVILAQNGKEGVEKARQEKPHLIILDVMLPLVSGLEACKILKQDDATRQIPIVILTALPRVEDAEQAFEVGANDFLNKPFTNERLLQKVYKYLPKKQ